MAQVKLRFYGRFVFAERIVGGKSQGLDVLAPNMQFQNTACAAHQVLMSVPRKLVDPELTKIAPTHRLMSYAQPDLAEHFVWNLAGYDMKVDAKGAYVFNSRAKLADMARLEAKQGRKAVLDRKNLKASARGPVAAAIRVPAGTVVAKSVWRSTYYFVPEGTKKPWAFPDPVEHADILEVAIQLPKSSGSLRLQLTDPKGHTRSLVLNAGKLKQADTVVSFTNLCAQLPRYSKWEEEFGQFYQLLKKRPKPALRLIPEVLPKAGEWGDCNLPSYISY